jgi:lactoylglutathione lyase
MTANTTTDDYNPDFWVWGEDEIKSRFLHAMVRVFDVDAALRFYVEGLGMTVLDKFDVEVRRSTGIFIGYDGYRQSALLELVNKWDDDQPYTHGTGYGHIAIGVPDLPATVEKLEGMGFEVTDQPRVLIAGGPLVAFVKDADGYAVELIQIQRG